jgi:hypothetical protein
VRSAVQSDRVPVVDGVGLRAGQGLLGGVSTQLMQALPGATCERGADSPWANTCLPALGTLGRLGSTLWPYEDYYWCRVD